MNVETSDFDKPLGNERFRVERPDHVPEEAVVEIDYHLFGGDADPRLRPGMTYQLAWKEVQDSDGPDMRWTPFNGGHWIPMKGALITEVLQNPDRFSSKYIALPKEVGELYDFIPLSLDPPQQTPYRAILNPLLSHKVVRPKEAPVRALAVELVEGFKDRGECDYVRDFANILPVATFHELVGLPEEEREELRKLATSGDQTKPESVEVMLAKIEEYLTPHLKRRRAEPGLDLFSGLLHSNVGDRPITDDEAMHMCKQLFVAGFHTTASSMTYAMYQMAKDKWLREELARDLPNIRFKVEELLRRFAMVSIPRTATRDTTLGGQEIKEGDPILLPLILHNMDDEIYPDPLRIDFKRRGPLQSGFGRGAHKCPGSVLGIVEISVALEEWLRRIPDFEITDQADVTMVGGGVARIENLPLKWDVT